MTKYYKIKDYFRQVEKMIRTGKGAERNIVDFELSKYACYLIAQNGDPDKSEITQAYFNIQTFRQKTSLKGYSSSLSRSQYFLYTRNFIEFDNIVSRR